MFINVLHFAASNSFDTTGINILDTVVVSRKKPKLTMLYAMELNI